jgi:hypothetical protein
VRELETELTKLRDTMNPLKLKDMQAQAEIQTLRMDKGTSLYLMVHSIQWWPFCFSKL